MLNALLQSRKFWLSIVSLAAVLLAHYSGLPVEVQAAIVAVFSTLVLAIAHEDNGKGGVTVIDRAVFDETDNQDHAAPDGQA